MSDLDDARSLFRDYLGVDWELTLIAADAMAGPETPIRAAAAALERAVELVSETSGDWQPETRDRVAGAWQILWLHGGAR